MKKRMCSVLAMMVVLALLIGSVGVLPVLGEDTRTGPIRGDVNFDGTIDVQDAGKVLLYLVGKWNDSWFVEAMDANQDGTINAVDATRILLDRFGKKSLPPLPRDPRPAFADNIVLIKVTDREDLLDYYTVELFSEYGVVEINDRTPTYMPHVIKTLYLTLDVHDEDNVLRVVERLQEREDVLSAEPCYYEYPD